MAKRKVMLVGEGVDRGIGNTLEERGYEVCRVATGVAAVIEFPRFRPDVVLADAALPDVSVERVLELLTDGDGVRAAVLTANGWHLSRGLPSVAVLAAPADEQTLLSLVEGL